MEKFVTVKEAAIMLDVSERTIHRRLSKMSDNLSKYVTKDGRQTVIDIRLVYGNFQELLAQPAHLKKESQQDNYPPAEIITETLDFLREQLTIKDREINFKNGQIAKLHKRLEEHSTIIDNLQKEKGLLLLMSAKDSTPKETEDNDTHPTKEPPSDRSGFTFVLVLVIILLLFALLLSFLDVF